MKSAMTAGEIETLRTILRLGGCVVVSMGRKRGPEYVRTSTINSLKAKGLIRLWSGPSTSLICVSGATWDYAVTAKGCAALAEVSS